MKHIICFLLLNNLLFLGCTKEKNSKLAESFPEIIEFSIENTSDLIRTDEIVSIDIEKIKVKAINFNPDAFIILSGINELPSQAVDVNGDGALDQIKFVINAGANKKNNITIRFAKSGKLKRKYKQRTQAELSHKVNGKFEDRKYIGGEFRNVDYLRVPPEHTDHSSFIRYEGPGWESDKVG